MVETTPKVAIRLEADCENGEKWGGAPCSELARKTHEQLSSDTYAGVCSVLHLQHSLSDWLREHRTARKRAARCERLGYSFGEIERADYEDDVFEINTSKLERQGRPMSAGYTQRQSFGALPFQPCERHRISSYGVLSPAGRLVAYLVVHRVGELVLISQILGHGDHEEYGVNFLDFRGMLEEQLSAGHGTAWYNRWDSGQDGLRDFKAWLGFKPAFTEWMLT
jgi:hypothetical protein